MILHLVGTDGRCQCCGEPGALRHVDPDLGFVCTDCFCALVMVDIALRQSAALNLKRDRKDIPS